MSSVEGEEAFFLPPKLITSSVEGEEGGEEGLGTRLPSMHRNYKLEVHLFLSTL